MTRYFQALAVDFDGTLTRTGGRPAPDVLDALRRFRDDGRRVLLVTGRILAELRADFPDVEDSASTIRGTVITFGLSCACAAASWRGLPKKTIQT